MSEKISVLATVHLDGQYQTVGHVSKAFSPVEVDRVIRLMSTLSTEAFLFSPLKEGGWVALCSTVNNQFDDDHRPGTMVVALFFDQSLAEELLEEPVQLFCLKRWMEHLDWKTTEQLLNGLEEWPLGIPGITPTLQRPGNVAKMMLQVVMANLVGDNCYAVSGGDDQDLLQLIQILPPKFRLGVSFSVPYTEFDGIQIYNGIDHVKGRILNPPNGRRFDVEAGTETIDVGPAGEKLAKTILRLRKNDTLDQLDASAKDPDDLLFQLKLLTELSQTVRSGDKKAATQLMKSYPELVTRLVPYLSKVEAFDWKELMEPPKKKKPPERDRSVPQFELNRLNVRATTILLMVLLALGYLLVGLSLEATTAAVYVSIRFKASVLFNVGFGLILGLCFGYLMFHNKNDKGGKS